MAGPGSEREKHFNRKLIAAVVFLVALSFWVGIHVGVVKNKEVEALAILAQSDVLPPENVDLSLLWEAWNILEDKFVPATTTKAVKPDDLLWGAISGLTDAYGDPYTVFFPPEEASTFQEDIDGFFGGVGMEIGIRNGILTVIAPLKDSPAEQAGIRSGDRVVEVNGEPTDNLSIDEAVRLIRGDVGTSVVLTLLREENNAIETVEVIRDVIEIPTLDTELREDGIFVISLYNFSAPSADLFRRALVEFRESASTKLVIDLRNNPGGFLEAAVQIASWFLPQGKVVVTEDFGPEQKKSVRRSSGSRLLQDTDTTDIVVLINGGSASASEILAGALREHGVATLIGTNTFGKGSVQELVNLTSATSLKVTIARWLTPLGVSISDGGIKPDIEVEITSEDIENGEDTQLNRAVDFLKGE